MSKDLIEVGEVFLIKNGVVTSNILHTSIEYMQFLTSDLNSKHAFIVNAIEESSNNLFQYYTDLIKNGYSVIRYSKVFHLLMENNHKISKIEELKGQLDCFVAPTISIDDYKEFVKTFNIVDMKCTSMNEKKFYNYFYDKDGSLDYDYLKEDERAYFYSLEERMNVLLREKLNLLTEQEKKEITEYRTYNLKDILTKSFFNNKVNHGNGGCVVITPNNIYKETLTKIQHGETYKNILYKECLIELDNMDNIIDMVENTNSIIIQLAKGYIIAWLNEENKRTDFQNEQLSQFMIEFAEIKRNYSDIDDSYAICSNGEAIELTFDDVINNSSRKNN